MDFLVDCSSRIVAGLLGFAVGRSPGLGVPFLLPLSFSCALPCCGCFCAVLFRCPLLLGLLLCCCPPLGFLLLGFWCATSAKINNGNWQEFAAPARSSCLPALRHKLAWFFCVSKPIGFRVIVTEVSRSLRSACFIDARWLEVASRPLWTSTWRLAASAAWIREAEIDRIIHKMRRVSDISVPLLRCVARVKLVI